MATIMQSSDSRYLKKDFYTYVTGPTVTIAAGGAGSSTFNIDGDSDFFWTKSCVFALAAGGGATYLTQTLPGVDVLITDATSGRQLMNEQVPLSSIAGTGQIPFILPIERYMASKTTIKVEYFNVGTVDLTLIRFSFIGVKAFLNN